MTQHFPNLKMQIYHHVSYCFRCCRSLMKRSRKFSQSEAADDGYVTIPHRLFTNVPDIKHQRIRQFCTFACVFLVCSCWLSHRSMLLRKLVPRRLFSAQSLSHVFTQSTNNSLHTASFKGTKIPQTGEAKLRNLPLLKIGPHTLTRVSVCTRTFTADGVLMLLPE